MIALVSNDNLSPSQRTLKNQLEASIAKGRAELADHMRVVDASLSKAMDDFANALERSGVHSVFADAVRRQHR